MKNKKKKMIKKRHRLHLTGTVTWTSGRKKIQNTEKAVMFAINEAVNALKGDDIDYGGTEIEEAELRIKKSVTAEKMRKLYEERMLRTEKEPKYAYVEIEMKEDGSREDVWIKLTEEIKDEKEDERTFFYCETPEELEELCEEDNGEDFTVTEIHELVTDII